jgi:hypothetical protein
MDCKTALRTLEVCRPSGDDVMDAEISLATAHVEECTDCLSHVRARQSFDARVAATMQAVLVPHDLRDRIQDRVQSIVTRRRYLQRASWFGAAAAVILIAACGYFWPRAHQTPIEIDWKSLSELAILDPSEIDELREVPINLKDARGVEAWCSKQLSQLRLSVSLPAIWRPLSLVAVGRATIQDRRAAIFRFQDARGDSEVLALPHEKFHITNLGKVTRLVVSTGDLVVIAWAEQDTTYVAVLKGWSPEDWQPLVRPAKDMT